MKKPIIGITTDVKDGCFSIEENYARSLVESGGIPFLIPSMAGNSYFLTDTIGSIDGLLLPGSRDMDPKFYNEEPHPRLKPMSLERTEFEFSALNLAVKSSIPVMGICGGMQLINVFFGGSLFQDIKAYIPEALPHENGATHRINVLKNTLLSTIVGADGFSAKSYHHQSVKQIGKGLKLCAETKDGIVEGIESEGKAFVLGVQWHPELEDTEVSRLIFSEFVKECGRRQ